MKPLLSSRRPPARANRAVTAPSLTRERPLEASPEAATSIRRPPFYPRHWRYFTVAVLGLCLYAGMLYVPADLDLLREQRAEEARLTHALQDPGNLSARWDRVRRQPSPPPSSTAYTLARLQDQAHVWNLSVLDLRRTDLDTSGTRWTLQASGRFPGIAGFVADLEAASSLALQRLQITSPDTASAALRVAADVVFPRADR